MKKIYEWMVWSSTNSDKISLTMRGMFSTFASIAVPLVAVIGYQEAGGQINELSANVISVVQAGLILISSIVTLVGFVRKVFLTYQASKPTL